MDVGILEALAAFLYVLVLGFFWRVAAIKAGDTTLGRAMTFIY